MCVGWVVVHLGVALDGLWGQVLTGEWDVLVGAVAVAEGEPLGLSLGAIRPTESGSALVSWFLAPLIALGVSPEVSGRVAGTLFGACLVGFAAHWAGTRARDPWGAVVTGGFLGFGWTALHLHTVGILGTSIQALLPLLIAARLVLETRRPVGWAGAGALVGVAILFSMAALPFVALLGLISLLRARTTPRPWLAPVAFSLSALAAFLFPFGLSSLGRPLLQWVMAAWSAPFLSVHETGGFLAGAREVIRVWPAALASDFVAPGLATGVMYGVALVFPFGLAAVAARRGEARGPALLGLVACGIVFGVPAEWAVYPNAFRHWMFPVLVGGVGLGVALAPFARRRPALVIGALVLLGIASTTTLTKVRPVPPPRGFAFAHFAGHRCQDRPLPPEISQRHGTLRALLPYVPEADQGALLEGYGVSHAVDYALWQVEDPTDLWPERLLSELSEPLRDAWYRGLGCGLGAFPSVDQRAERTLAVHLANPTVVEARRVCAGPPTVQETWSYPDLPGFASFGAQEARARHVPAQPPPIR